MEKADKDVLNVITHITGFGEGGGIGDAERYVKHLCDSAGQESLASACLAYDDDVGLLDFDIVHVVMFGGVFQAFIMVIDGD